MAEVRATSVIILLVVVGAVGAVVLAFFGVIGIGWLNQKNLQDLTDKGVAVTKGYAGAKTPSEAMDFFHKAIQDRDYKVAANYTTKEYGEQLKRETRASELGRYTDSIRSFAIDKGFINDRLTYTLNSFDPFPKNFKPGPAPVVAGDKASGTFLFEPVKYETTNPLTLMKDPPFKDMDVKMFQNLYRQPFGIITEVMKIDLVKEGDEWKLNIPSNPIFEANVTYYMAHSKSYDTALNGFVIDMNRLRNVTKSEFEIEVMKVLRESK